MIPGKTSFPLGAARPAREDEGLLEEKGWVAQGAGSPVGLGGQFPACWGCRGGLEIKRVLHSLLLG